MASVRFAETSVKIIVARVFAGVCPEREVFTARGAVN